MEATLLKQFVKTVIGRLDRLPHGVSFAADYRRKFPQKPIRLIFDVGANVGQSVIEFQQDFPSATILSFEPDKNSFAILQRVNDRAYNLALSSSPGQLRFDNRSPDSKIHSIANDQGDESLPIVSVTTVDHFCSEQNINHIDLLKIDTEGHDLEVISGASRMLRDGGINAVIAECSLKQQSRRLVSYSQLQTAMRDRGYVCFGIYQQALGGNEINWGNCAFVPQSM